jgi:Poly(ADP-ribose) polymerase catalytic domain
MSTSNNAAVSSGGDCFAWIDDPSLRGAGALTIVAQHFLAVCETESFLQHCASLGFGSPSFVPNPCLTMEWPGYKKFATCYEHETARPDVSVPPPEGGTTPRRLGLVFHGTRSCNILNILNYGLDASLRNGQSFGPGEYFSTTPTTSISYCRGGMQLPTKKGHPNTP